MGADVRVQVGGGGVNICYGVWLSANHTHAHKHTPAHTHTYTHT